jgi:hypothetical protein
LRGTEKNNNKSYKRRWKILRKEVKFVASDRHKKKANAAAEKKHLSDNQSLLLAQKVLGKWLFRRNSHRPLGGKVAADFAGSALAQDVLGDGLGPLLCGGVHLLVETASVSSAPNASFDHR